MRDKEKVFCDEYLIDLNAMQAAIRAGYKLNTAKDASQWIDPDDPKKPALRKYIDEAMAKRARRTGVSADRVVRELARIAFGDPLSVMDPETGALKEDISEDDRAMVAGYRVKKGDSSMEREIKLYDKCKSLEMLGRHLGMFTDNVVAGVTVSTAERAAIMSEIRARMAAEGDGIDGGDGK